MATAPCHSWIDRVVNPDVSSLHDKALACWSSYSVRRTRVMTHLEDPLP